MSKSATCPFLVTVLLAAACTCPPLLESYATPEAVLATWQSRLCHDDTVGEYKCLSAGLKTELAGFETYYAARRQLLEEEPLLAWLLKHTDLAARAVDRSVSADGLRATMAFEQDDRRYTIGFVQETWVELRLTSDDVAYARLDGPLSRLLSRSGARQWLELPRPVLDAGQLSTLQAVLVEQRWKIAALSGLAPPPSTAVTP